ncbi:mitogen-activated protein kinase kinase kinase 20-related [Anaeramoeba ignava]|uniref:Mitogen-activated protein kinase kinase kinase 20-related n=1 Tax=Anaeramoeba ignava TaxID=1746090 RepID=A0A9Q0LJI9_ANAIG|nr:mitogen-activated protein kinase kinase kinase 20-related [Anaeramoeba ignava]
MISNYFIFAFFLLFFLFSIIKTLTLTENKLIYPTFANEKTNEKTNEIYNDHPIFFSKSTFFLSSTELLDRIELDSGDLINLRIRADGAIVGINKFSREMYVSSAPFAYTDDFEEVEVIYNLNKEIDNNNFNKEIDNNNFNKEIDNNNFDKKIDNNNFDKEIELNNFDKETELNNLNKEIDNNNFDKEIELNNFDKEIDNNNFDKEIDNNNLNKEIELNNLNKEIDNNNFDKEIENNNLDKEIELNNFDKEIELNNFDKEIDNNNLDKEIDNNNLDKEIELNNFDKEIHLNNTFSIKNKIQFLSLSKNSSKKSLIVDPLVYSSFFGGHSDDVVTAFQLSPELNEFSFLIAGVTQSMNFPIENNIDSMSEPHNEIPVAFITHMNYKGIMSFSTLFGPLSQSETQHVIPTGVFHDLDGNHWVTGYTSISDIPTSINSLSNKTHNSITSGFILQLSKHGNHLMYSTLFGGDHDSSATKIYGLGYSRNFGPIIAGITNSTSLLNGVTNLADSEDTNSAFIAFLEISPETSFISHIIKIGESNNSEFRSLAVFEENGIQNYTNIVAAGTTDYPNLSTYPQIDGDFPTGTAGFMCRFNISYSPFSIIEKVCDYIGTNASFVDDSICAVTLDIGYSGSLIDSYFISGSTKNYENFTGNFVFASTNLTSLAPHYDFNASVGYALRASKNGHLNYSILVGCKDADTYITSTSFHLSNILSISGVTSCDMNMNNSVWNDINKDELKNYSTKSFVLKVNITQIEQSTQNETLEQFIIWSSYIDPYLSDHPRNQFSTIQLDYSGNIYSIFNIPSGITTNLTTTIDAYQDTSPGGTSIFIQVFGGFECEIGSYSSSAKNICIPCEAGHYSNKINMPECKLCSENENQPFMGSIECLGCLNTTNEKGKTDCVNSHAPYMPTIWVNETGEDEIKVQWISPNMSSDNISFNLRIFSDSIDIYFFVQNCTLIDNNTCETEFDGLYQDTSYYISIQSILNTGTESLVGSWTATILETTYGPPYRINPSSIKQNYDKNTEFVSWDPPFDNNQEIFGYILTYGIRSRDRGTFEMNSVASQNPNVTIRNLKPNQTYYLDIFAINRGGTGPSLRDAGVMFLSGYSAPAPVEIFQKTFDTDGLLLSWNPPENYGSNISNYRYQLKNKPGSMKNISNDTTEYLVSECDEQCTVTIQAANQFGWSDENYKDFQMEKASKTISYVLIGITVGLAVIIIVLVATRSKIKNTRRKKAIRSRMKRMKKNFDKHVLHKLVPQQETWFFEAFRPDLVFDITSDIETKMYVRQGDHIVILNEHVSGGLVFCKQTSKSEIEILEYLWKKYLELPMAFPMIQFIGGTEKQPGHNRKRSIKRKKQFDNVPQNDPLELSSETDSDSDQIDSIQINDNLEKIQENSLKDSSKQMKIFPEMKKKTMIISVQYFPMSLYDYLHIRKERKQAFQEDEKIWIAFNLAKAIQFIHSCFVIHRDIKPKNIMIGTDGFLRVVDFNTAVKLRKGQAVFRGPRVGTLEYFDDAPSYHFDPKTGQSHFLYTYAHDIYSYGRVLQDLYFDDSDVGFEIVSLKDKFHTSSEFDVDSDTPNDELLGKNISQGTEVDRIMMIIIDSCLANPKIRTNWNDILQNLQPFVKTIFKI